MAGNEAVTVVQFTDTHFFASPNGRLMGVDTAQTFLDVSKLAHANSGTPDFYLLTGDLSQDETEASYERFSSAIKEFKAPAYFLPGNHDARPLMLRAFDKNSAPFRSDTTFTTDHWHVILLDTQIPGKIGGHLSDEELSRLGRELARHPDKHALVSMHHHPVPVGSAWIDKIMVDNGDEFFAIIDKYTNVRAVLWGHIHQQFDSSRNGVKLMATPSTCVQFKPKSDAFAVDEVPPGYRWLKLHADGTLETGVQRVDKVAAGLDLKSGGY